jgi:drug/metabolite transporter (DMT)-like permease
MRPADFSGRGLSIALALAAALLFGLSAPAAKMLVSVTDPWLVAGLLYLGSGPLLALFLVARRAATPGRRHEASLARGDWPWLSAAILTGSAVGPVLLMFDAHIQ